MTGEAGVAPVLCVRFWRGFGITLRPYLMFLSLAAGLLGLALTELGAIRYIYALAFFFTYGLGQALTDTFQTDTDALSSPYRPLVRGEIGRRQVLAVSLAGLLVCSLVFAIANPWSAVPALAAVLGLASYTWFKRRWWGGPPWNSWIVATLPIIGVLCAGATLGEVLARTELQLAVASVFATYAPFVVLGYLKDVTADAATGYNTVVVRFGPRPAVAVSLLHSVAGIVVSTALITRSDFGFSSQPAIILWLFGWVLMFAAHTRLWLDPSEATAYRGIAFCAGGFVSIHLGEAAVLQPATLVPALIINALFVWMLWRRPMREQI